MSFEIDVTKYVELGPDAMSEYSASVLERGENAGQLTWKAACAAQEDESERLVTPEQQPELRAYFLTFGAWTEEEIANMSDQEMCGLLLQMIAGDIRDLAEDAEDSGGLSKGDDGSWYYYVGE
jgi:hypothetical protein